FVTFTGSSATLPPSVEALSMPIGGTSLSGIEVARGLGSYDTATTCHGTNRWGDYAGAAMDPSYPSDVWVAAELTASSTNSCDWGTSIARLTVAAPTISALTPSMGSIRGGTTVTICGASPGTGGGFRIRILPPRVR